MRQFATLLLSVGVLAAPAFSQTGQAPSLAGKWVKYNVAQDGTTLLRFESVELRQIGNQLAGTETIAERPGRVVVLSLTGRTTGASGVIRETGVQRLQRFRQPCLLDADFRMSGPDTLVISWQPEIDCDDQGTIVLSREKQQPQNVTRNRQQQNNSLLGAILLGMMGGDRVQANPAPAKPPSITTNTTSR